MRLLTTKQQKKITENIILIQKRLNDIAKETEKIDANYAVLSYIDCADRLAEIAVEILTLEQLQTIIKSLEEDENGKQTVRSCEE